MRIQTKNNVNFALFLDQKKPFNTVDHEVLIRKLKVYGIKNIEVEWLRSSFEKHEKYFPYGHKSCARPVTGGIPQGPCLGSLLLEVFLNNCKTCVKFSEVYLFADVTEVSLSSNELGDVIQTIQAELENNL